MSEELKPCPFCGNVEVRFSPIPNAVFCPAATGGCGAIGGFRESSRKDAVDAWNMRAEHICKLELITTEVDENGDACALGVRCTCCGLLDEDEIGVDPDNWMLWKFCPKCGSKVVS